MDRVPCKDLRCRAEGGLRGELDFDSPITRRGLKGEETVYPCRMCGRLHLWGGLAVEGYYPLPKSGAKKS